MEPEQHHPIDISIWGKFPEQHHTAPNDFLWHDAVESLPELGSVLLIDGTAFQVEAICLDAYDTEQQTYIVEVRPYAGRIPSMLVFIYPDP